ncbi:MAG: LPS export ABC transporter permease LptF [Paracoccaceae bacterium]
MAKFDKYLLSQLMVLFGFFSLVLVLVYWVNRAVVLFDQLIANGQSAIVFLEFTALSLPNVIRLVMPMSAFAASVYVVNRLSSESELVVVQATGYSPWRLMRPVLVFSILVALLVSIMTHFLVPASLAELRERRTEIANDMTNRLFREGTFLHPANGMTFYIREITPEGEMLDVFLSDARSETQHTTYTARRALLIRDDAGPKLIMFEGTAQTLRLAGQRLSITGFDDLAFDVASMMGTTGGGRPRPAELSTRDLLFPSPELVSSTAGSRAELLQEGHARFAQASLSLVAALIGFATLLLGGFSRFGLWRQMLAAVVILIVLKSFDNLMADAAAGDETLWPLVYASTGLGLVVLWALLWLAERPALFRRRSRQVAP